MTDFVQLRSGVIIPAADFAEASRPVLGEIATTRDGRDITRGYVNALQLLQPQDSVLRLRGGGNFEIYQEVLRDDQVKTAFEQRRLAVVSKEWAVEPGGKRAVDKAAADFLREQLQATGWDRVTDRMLFGVFYGYAVAELLYGVDGRFVTMDAIRVRDRRRFAFDGAQQLRLLTSTSNALGELLPERKFWAFQTGADHDDEPYGLGLAHWLYWPAFFKRGGIKLWLTFLDKFAAPTALGKYPTGADTTQQNRLLQSLAAIRTDGGVIVPEGMQVELIEAARSGTADYTALYDRMNAAIAKVVLGHTGSTDSTPGKLGGESNAADVREDLINADADLVCESFNQGPARWLTEWNFPGAAVPRVWRRTEPKADLKEVSEYQKNVFDMGYKPKLGYIADTYGGEWEEKAPLEPPKPPAPNAAQPAPAFAEPTQCPHCADFADAAGPDALDGLRDLALEGWQPLMRPVTNPLVAALDAALQRGDSLADFAEVLPGLLEKMDISKLTESLANAGFMARAAGDAIPDEP